MVEEWFFRARDYLLRISELSRNHHHTIWHGTQRLQELDVQLRSMSAAHQQQLSLLRKAATAATAAAVKAADICAKAEAAKETANGLAEGAGDSGHTNRRGARGRGGGSAAVATAAGKGGRGGGKQQAPAQPPPAKILTTRQKVCKHIPTSANFGFLIFPFLSLQNYLFCGSF